MCFVFVLKLVKIKKLSDFFFATQTCSTFPSFFPQGWEGSCLRKRKIESVRKIEADIIK